MPADLVSFTVNRRYGYDTQDISRADPGTSLILFHLLGTVLLHSHVRGQQEIIIYAFVLVLSEWFSGSNRFNICADRHLISPPLAFADLFSWISLVTEPFF